MRWFFEEQFEWAENEIKHYINELNEFTDEALIDEIAKNTQKLYKNSPWAFNEKWLFEYKETLKKHDHIDLITMAIEEKYYIFNDDEEHEKNKEMVEKLIK